MIAHIDEELLIKKQRIIMKKCLFCLILIISFSQTAYSQNVDQLLSKLSKTENIEKITIGRFVMSLGKLFGGVGDMPVARGVHSMVVYSLSDSRIDVKQDFAKMFNNLKDGAGYETLIIAKDKVDAVRIMVKKKKDIITDLVILCMDEADPTFVKFSGKIKEKDIAELVDSKY